MIEPADDEVDLFGKHVSDLESNISVSGNVIYGTSKYVTGYTGFSGNPDEQQGNYFAFKVVGDADRVRVKNTNGGNWITLDPDRTHVWILKNGNQGGMLVEKKVGNEITTDEYSFSGLTLEQPNG